MAINIPWRRTANQNAAGRHRAEPSKSNAIATSITIAPHVIKRENTGIFTSQSKIGPNGPDVPNIGSNVMKYTAVPPFHSGTDVFDIAAFKYTQIS